MNCVKCGREIGENQVFCEACLGEMENYPVRPGTAIHIPARESRDEFKKAQQKKKPLLTPSEQILRLKKKVQRLRILLVLTLLICGLLCFVVGRIVTELDFQRLMGQNYHIVSTPTEEKPTEPPVETIVP